MPKTAIVTGGSRGIGEAIVRMLSKEGYNVILNYNKSEDKARKIQKEIKNIDIVKADVSTRKGAKDIVEITLNKYKNIDVLINNAGISQTKLFTDITDEDWNTMINTNLSSAFYMCQEVLPNMLHNKSGCIINISSIWGITGASCEVHYSVAKAGMDGLTKSLAKEVGPSNIRVNSIAPGIINTDMNKKLSIEDKKNIINEIPLEKIGEPEDVANAVKWLIGDSYTTGQIISVNGGWNI